MLISERLTSNDEMNIVAERKRIARDLHDGVTQQFAHVLHKLAFIERLLEAQEWQSSSVQVVLDEIRRTYALQKTGVDELRTHIASLSIGAAFMTPSSPMPVIDAYGDTVSGEGEERGHEDCEVDKGVGGIEGESVGYEDVGYEGAINLAPTGVPSPVVALVEDFRQRNPDVEVSYIEDQTHYLTTALMIPIFRVVQEALNNVQKHAQASHVMVCIRVFPHKCIVEISDDGIGFHVPLGATTAIDAGDIHAAIADQAKHSGLGLHIMHERIQETGGVWEIDSTPGKGTTIRARFPYV